MIDAQTYDSKDLRFKTPYGAVPGGTEVTFTLRPLRSEGYSRGILTARLESWDNKRIEVPMVWTGLDGERDMFTGSINTDGYMGLIWYSFRLERLDGKSGRESQEYQLTVYDENDKVPLWFGDGMTYQIFPDRFCRLTVPNPDGMVGGRWVHQGWEEEPEYRPDHKGEIRNRDFFGGSLAGIRTKLSYLRDLGVETIYLCPIFEGPENHRYGVGDYEKVDPMLGTREEFSALCDEAHAMGMRVMLDGVFNHTAFVSKYFNGDGSYPNPGACQGPQSPYYDWFCFQHWPNQYTSWWGIYSLPTTNKNSPTWLEYITGKNGVIRSWLRAGADGWRLDVADELPDRVVAAIHDAARAEKPDAVIIGEVWEDGSNKIAYSVRRKHILGGHCDGLMNYPFRTALVDYLLGGSAEHFKNSMETLRENYPPFAWHLAMNTLGTHDTMRILTLLGEKSEQRGQSRDWRAHARLNDHDRAHGKARLTLGAMVLFAFPGAPTVYYGDEAGMEGFEDPFNRRTFPWGHEDRELVSLFTALGAARKSRQTLRRGDIRYEKAEGRVLAFTRSLDGETVLCAVNAGHEAETVTIPWEGTAVDLLGSQNLEAEEGLLTLELPPLTGRLLATPER
ncbi:glycoside hydrolase family 13 protein [Pseudoflavonifractor sp.]|uniref:glycoside hydrolase family 13 protein n=1 Tax=Pseudoflavonifractor sp. TaxID=1980281 RepID=UPI003D90411F